MEIKIVNIFSGMKALFHSVRRALSEATRADFGGDLHRPAHVSTLPVLYPLTGRGVDPSDISAEYSVYRLVNRPLGVMMNCLEEFADTPVDVASAAYWTRLLRFCYAVVDNQEAASGHSALILRYCAIFVCQTFRRYSKLFPASNIPNDAHYVGQPLLLSDIAHHISSMYPYARCNCLAWSSQVSLENLRFYAWWNPCVVGYASSFAGVYDCVPYTIHMHPTFALGHCPGGLAAWVQVRHDRLKVHWENFLLLVDSCIRVDTHEDIIEVSWHDCHHSRCAVDITDYIAAYDDQRPTLRFVDGDCVVDTLPPRGGLSVVPNCIGLGQVWDTIKPCPSGCVCSIRNGQETDLDLLLWLHWSAKSGGMGFLTQHLLVPACYDAARVMQLQQQEHVLRNVQDLDPFMTQLAQEGVPVGLRYMKQDAPEVAFVRLLEIGGERPEWWNGAKSHFIAKAIKWMMVGRFWFDENGCNYHTVMGSGGLSVTLIGCGIHHYERNLRSRSDTIMACIIYLSNGYSVKRLRHFGSMQMVLGVFPRPSKLFWDLKKLCMTSGAVAAAKSSGCCESAFAVGDGIVAFDRHGVYPKRLPKRYYDSVLSRGELAVPLSDELGSSNVHPHDAMGGVAAGRGSIMLETEDHVQDEDQVDFDAVARACGIYTPVSDIISVSRVSVSRRAGVCSVFVRSQRLCTFAITEAMKSPSLLGWAYVLAVVMAGPSGLRIRGANCEVRRRIFALYHLERLEMLGDVVEYLIE